MHTSVYFKRFCFPPHYILRDTPEILDLGYKIEPDTVHVTKFHDDRPWELVDPVKPQQLNSTLRYRHTRLYYYC